MGGKSLVEGTKKKLLRSVLHKLLTCIVILRLSDQVRKVPKV